VQKVPQGEFQPDGEEEKDDPHFGENVDGFHHPDQPKAVRPGQYAREKESNNGSNPQAVTGIEHDDGKAENDENVAEKDELHGNLLKKKDSGQSFSRAKKHVHRITQNEILNKETKSQRGSPKRVCRIFGQEECCVSLI
jgi:hypothetical protein